MRAVFKPGEQVPVKRRRSWVGALRLIHSGQKLVTWERPSKRLKLSAENKPVSGARGERPGEQAEKKFHVSKNILMLNPNRELE